MDASLKIFLIVIFFFSLFFTFLIFRVDFISVSYSDVCKYQYGENYTFEYIDSFGKYCVELDYNILTKINPKPFNWTDEEILEMCETPKFFELNRWDKGVCGD